MGLKIEDKIVVTCRYVSVLTASILKAKGYAVRIRSGCAPWIRKNEDCDHWICEYYNMEEKRWISYDVDEQLHDHKSKKLIFAAQAWLDVRAGKRDLNYFVHGSNIRGLAMLARSVFYDFLVNEDFMDKNPTDKIERIIVEKKIRKSFTNAELDALRNACDNKRDRALVEFLYSTGARLGEVVALNVRDINYNEGEVIVFGKGHKERRVYLSDECMKFLHEYLESRFAQPDDPLFMSNTDSKRISSRGIQEALRLIGMKAGVDNVHPHRFRRTMATHLLDRGMPIEQIKEVLGHERIDTTMIYCNVNSEKVKSSFKDAFNNYYRR